MPSHHHHRAAGLLGLMMLVALVGPGSRGADAAPLTALAVNEARYAEGEAPRDGVDPVILRAQILLDRLHLSPGSIDGRSGDNFAKALGAFAATAGGDAGAALSVPLWERLVATFPGPVLVPYTVTEADARGPYLDAVPKSFEDMAELRSLAHTSPAEAIAERFHAAPALLRGLNPDATWNAGDVIVVPSVRPEADPRRAKAEAARTKAPPRVARIEVDKTRLVLRAFDAGGAPVATYPASVGSEEKPAPSGRAEVTAVAPDPTYTYDPAYRFKGVKAQKKLEIAAGPNNPVGAVWIDLSVDSYGIHGTPEPERIGKSFSNGCVRLTNWDAKELASWVGPGTVVDFVD